MNTESDWQKALKQTPGDPVLLLGYADWLEERGERLKALQVRQQAGAGTLVFSLWHPSWGNKRSGMWPQLAHLKSHVLGRSHSGKYSSPKAVPNPVVPLAELVVLVEWTTEVARLPYSSTLSL